MRHCAPVTAGNPVPLGPPGAAHPQAQHEREVPPPLPAHLAGFARLRVSATRHFNFSSCSAVLPAPLPERWPAGGMRVCCYRARLQSLAVAAVSVGAVARRLCHRPLLPPAHPGAPAVGASVDRRGGAASAGVLWQRQRHAAGGSQAAGGAADQGECGCGWCSAWDATGSGRCSPDWTFLSLLHTAVGQRSCKADLQWRDVTVCWLC